MLKDTTITKGVSLFTLMGIPDLFPKTPVVNRVEPDQQASKVDETFTSWYSNLPIAPWGIDNQFPQTAKAKFKLNSLAMALMKFRVEAHYGKGVRLYKEALNEDKTIKKELILEDKIWNDFSKINKVPMLQARLASDWEWWRNQFVEIILSNDGTKINRVFRQPAMFCRWEKLNPITYKPDNCYISSQWGVVSSKDDVKIVPALDWEDPVQDLRDYIKAGGKGRRFMLGLKLQEMDAIYYDQAYWAPLLDTWIPLSTQVAYVKQALLKNQMVLKFHIKVPHTYWTTKFDGWNDSAKFPPEKKAEAINNTLTEINSFLTDTDNYGKSIISGYGRDPLDPNVITDELKIDVIDNSKIKDSAHIIDAQHANGEISTGLGVDPTLIGGQLPGGKEAGSGSNKRESFWIHQAKSNLDRMMTTQWFQHVKDYNGWPDEWKLGYEDIDTSQTLNQNPTGKKDVI